MVVSAYSPRCPRWHTALVRFSEELGIGKERPEHAPQEVGCVRNPGTGAGFGRQCLPGICPDPKRPRVVPGHRCFASVGRKLSLLPRRETFSGSGQTHPKARAETGTAKRERGNPYRERSGTGYCYELNGLLPRPTSSWRPKGTGRSASRPATSGPSEKSSKDSATVRYSNRRRGFEIVRFIQMESR